MKITVNSDYETFVQDLVLRITSTPGFKADNAGIEKACQDAFKVATVFFTRWEVERERLEEGAGQPDGEKAPAARKTAKAAPKEKRARK